MKGIPARNLYERLGFVGVAYGYSQNASTRELYSRQAVFLSQGEFYAASDYFSQSVSQLSYEHGGLFGVTFENGLNHEFSWTNFLIHMADDTLNEAQGRSDGDTLKYTSAWFERSLWVSQLEGRSRLVDFGNVELDWALQRGIASAHEPLTPSYTFLRPDGADDFTLSSTKINYQNNDLEDELLQFRLDARYRFGFISEVLSSVSAGVALSRKERDARSRRFALFFEGNPTYSPDELDGAIDSFTIDDVAKVNLSSRPTESYTATHDIDAVYLKTNLFPREELEIELGTRFREFAAAGTIGAGGCRSCRSGLRRSSAAGEYHISAE